MLYFSLYSDFTENSRQTIPDMVIDNQGTSTYVSRIALQVVEDRKKLKRPALKNLRRRLGQLRIQVHNCISVTVDGWIDGWME